LLISVPAATATSAAQLLGIGATASLIVDFQEIPFFDIAEIHLRGEFLFTTLFWTLIHADPCTARKGRWKR